MFTVGGTSSASGKSSSGTAYQKYFVPVYVSVRGFENAISIESEILV